MTKETHNRKIWPTERQQHPQIPKVLPEVPGLYYIKDFISKEESELIMKTLDGNIWEKVIRRRQQFIGKRYYHTTHNNEEIQPLDDVDDIDLAQLSWLLDKITTSENREKYDIFNTEWPNQILCNEYVERFGISTHFDSSEAFGKCIVTISLLQPIVMTFRRPLHQTNHCTTLEEEHDFILEPRSMLIMTGDSRYKWRHGITRRRWFEHEGVKINRDATYRRVSLTIREVLDTRKKTNYTDVGAVHVNECECITSPPKWNPVQE